MDVGTSPEPTWMASNFVSGVKRVPVRYRLR